MTDKCDQNVNSYLYVQDLGFVRVLTLTLCSIHAIRHLQMKQLEKIFCGSKYCILILISKRLNRQGLKVFWKCNFLL